MTRGAAAARASAARALRVCRFMRAVSLEGCCGLPGRDAASFGARRVLWELLTRRAGTLRAMDHALLLLPDFLLIASGFVICRYTALDRSVWGPAETLVYYLLFPVLLFNSILRSPMTLGALATLGLTGLSIVLVGIALAYALGRVPGI